MSELVISAFSSISLKSIFTGALIRSQEIVTHSIHITTVCSLQTLIYVWDNKMNIISIWKLFWLALAARIFVFTRAFPFLLPDKNTYQYSLSYFPGILSCTRKNTIQWCYCMWCYPHSYVYQTSTRLCLQKETEDDGPYLSWEINFVLSSIDIRFVKKETEGLHIVLVDGG